jgi:hypothetical protein
LVLGAATGCVDADPFRLSDRTVLGAYYLNKFESGAFYLCHEQRDCSGYGVLEGTVRSIGWNDRYILVWQNPDFGQAGWMLVDSRTNSISGPFTLEQANVIAPVANIKTHDAAEAWEVLGGT